MDRYTIVRKGDVLNWEKVPAVKIDKWFQTEPMPISAQAQVCYDEKALYVRLSAVESNIKADLFGPLVEVSDDSCLEFFFSPVAGDKRYFNIEVNPNGAIFLGFGKSFETLTRLLPEVAVIRPEITMTEDGWIVEYAFPHDYVQIFSPQYSPAPGYEMKGNFYKCAGDGNPPHFMCWQQVVPKCSAFHNPDLFGTLIFE